MSSPYAPPSGTPATARPPSRAVAAFLSLLATGLGHVYAGQTVRGLAWALGSPVAVLAWLVLLERLRVDGALLLLMGLFGLAPYLAMIVDAARVSSRASSRRAGIVTICTFGVGLFALGVGVRFGLRRFVIEAFKIPSGSMVPSILVGDRVFVDKTRHTVHRGDLVVFRLPEHPEQDFIKRVVGLPGDRIQFTSGLPVVNGVVVPSCRVGSGKIDGGEQTVNGDLFVEVLDGRPYLAFYDSQERTSFPQEEGPWTVKSGEVFFVGDNRYNAYDSRKWFGGKGGGAPIANVLGVAFVVWMSGTGYKVDWDRVGLRLDSPHLPAALAGLDSELKRCLNELNVR